MKTLHTAYRVTDLPNGRVCTLDLVHRPADGPVDVGTGFSHLVVQVDDLAEMTGASAEAGLNPGPIENPGGPAGPQMARLVDPDGYRIELVQWPSDHSDGVSAADFG